MTKLLETYRQLLREFASISDVISAIDNHNVVKFFYEGDHTEARGERIGEIYALGESTAGNKVVRVFQLKGATDTVVPNWKLFRVDKMRDIEVLRTFSKPRPLFNVGGDNTMTRVFNIAKFN